MNNCEKCGNPLQPGLTTCPICGTTAKSLDAAITAQPTNNEPIEALDEPPIASAPLTTAAPAAPMQAQPMDINPAPASPITPAQPMDIGAPATPVPLPEGTPSFETPTQVASQPAMFTDAGFTGMGINAATPSNQPVTLDVPASATTPAPATPQQTNPQPDKVAEPKKEKKPNNTLLLIIVAIASLGLGVGAGFIISSSMTKPAPAPTEEVAETNENSENGYTFNIEEGWTPTTIGGKLIITNKDNDVTLRFSNNSGQFTNINASNIEVSLATKEGYTDVTAEKTTLGDKDVVIANAKNGDIYIQYYYTAHDVSNIIYVTVIYETKEAKDANEEKVKAIIESTKYTEEIQNAIEAISPHSQIYDDSTYLYFESFANEEVNSNE